MKVEINRPIQHHFSDTKVDLPRDYESYHEIYSYAGRGDFINSIMRFNSDLVQFKLEIDGEIVTEIILNDFKDFFVFSSKNNSNISPISLSKDSKEIVVDFGSLVEFRKSIKFFARASTNSDRRDLIVWQVIHTVV